MDKFKCILRTNRKIMVFLYCLFIISIIFGSVLPFFLSSSDRSLISMYFQDFIKNIGACNFLTLFFNGLFSNFGFCLIIFVLGISIVGSFFVIFLFFLKGFILGFSISSIIINYGFKGILFGFVYLFPHQIINMFIYSILTCYSISFSFKFILFLFKKYNFNIHISFIKFFKVFCICSFFIILSILYESFLLPKLFSFVFDLLNL